MATLSNTRQEVERSLFESLRKISVSLGYLPDVNAISEVSISSINQGNKTFTLNGVNLQNLYLPRRKFNVKTSTANDGEYTVVSSTYQASNTIITVKESIPSSTADGVCSIYIYYDDTTGIAYYQSALDSVIAAKGFVVEIFGVGQHRAKYQKKIPRIAIVNNQTLPGALGGNGDKIYTIDSNPDPYAVTSYTARVTPPQTVDMTYDLHLVSSTAEQSRVLHGILALAIPRRGYVSLITNPLVKFFVEHFSDRSIPNPSDNIMEDIYMYKVSDLYETDNEIVAQNIKPIKEIRTTFNVGTPERSIPLGNDMIVDEHVLELIFSSDVEGLGVVTDAGDIGKWNMLFGLPGNGKPFASVKVEDNKSKITLTGGRYISLQYGVLSDNTNILSIIDTGCITTLTEDCLHHDFALHTAVFPWVSYAESSVMNECTVLKNVQLPKLVTSVGSMFGLCTSLEEIELPSLISTGSSMFNGCTALKKALLPVCTTVGPFAFNNCDALEEVYLPACTNLGGTTGDNSVFANANERDILVTIPAALMTANSGNPDGDIQYLQTEDQPTFVLV